MASDDFARAVVLVGQKVRAAREGLGLTQLELSDRAEIDIKSVQNVEYARSSGKKNGVYDIGNPKLDTMWKLSRALGITIDYLVDPNRPVEQFEGPA